MPFRTPHFIHLLMLGSTNLSYLKINRNYCNHIIWMFADLTNIAQHFAKLALKRLHSECAVCVAEPWYSVGALPQCAISRWQQAGSNHAKPGSLGRQEGVDQGRTGVTTEAYVWVAICSLYIFYFFCFLLQWCWCFPGWSENRSVLPAALPPLFTAWLLIKSSLLSFIPKSGVIHWHIF